MVEFTRHVRDRNQKRLNEGDIIVVEGNHAVIEKINRVSREKFPDINVTMIETDWKGTKLTTKKKRLLPEIYRKSTFLHKSRLRDDYKLHQMLFELTKRF